MSTKNSEAGPPPRGPAPTTPRNTHEIPNREADNEQGRVTSFDPASPSVVVYGFFDLSYPWTERARLEDPERAPVVYQALPLSDALAQSWGDDAVICPIVYPGALRPDLLTGPCGVRPNKAILGTPEGAGAYLGLLLLDFDTAGHRAWTSTEDAAAAVRALRAAWCKTFGADALVYASPKGVRVLTLPHDLVPLSKADAYLGWVRERAAKLGGRGLKPAADALTWTTGQRPPWTPNRPAPWGRDYPPHEGTPAPITLYPDVSALEDETPPRNVAIDIPPDDAPADRTTARLDDESRLMAAKIRGAEGGRHPTAIDLGLLFGGWCAHLGRSPARWVPLFVAAMGDSRDAERTVRWALEHGLAEPLEPYWCARPLEWPGFEVGAVGGGAR